MRCLGFVFGLVLFVPVVVCVAQTPPTLNVQNRSTAPPAGSPVEVEDCKLQEIGRLLVAKTGKLIVEFTNESNVTPISCGSAWGGVRTMQPSFVTKGNSLRVSPSSMSSGNPREQ